MSDELPVVFLFFVFFLNIGIASRLKAKRIKYIADNNPEAENVVVISCG